MSKVATSCPECGAKGQEETDNPAIVHKTKICPDCANKISEEKKSLDWEKAWAHFCDVRKSYQDLAGTPGVNTSLALEVVFRPLATRYENGERTDELYNELISVE